MTSAPKIEPIKLKEFEVKQSRYDIIPFRAIIIGPSGSGKTILLQNLVMDVYKNCFARVYIFSPSINVDMTWQPVKQYIEEEWKLSESDEEQFYFDSYEPEKLSENIHTQHQIIDHMKKEGYKTIIFHSDNCS
jgi:ABC-type oligopeptide transport system ATPase subunit